MDVSPLDLRKDKKKVSQDDLVGFGEEATGFPDFLPAPAMSKDEDAIEVEGNKETTTTRRHALDPEAERPAVDTLDFAYLKENVPPKCKSEEYHETSLLELFADEEKDNAPPKPKAESSLGPEDVFPELFPDQNKEDAPSKPKSEERSEHEYAHAGIFGTHDLGYALIDHTPEKRVSKKEETKERTGRMDSFADPDCAISSSSSLNLVS